MPRRRAGNRLRLMEGELCIRMLKALADETRWRIVRALLEREMTVGEVTERLKATPYNVSKHVRILREAGIIETRREGKSVHCAVAAAFRQRLSRQRSQLDLGCCTFRFFQPLKSPRARGAAAK